MNNLVSTISIIIIVINVAFIITAVFFERKKPVQALSWVITLSLLPLIGFFLYLLFGRRSYRQYSHKVFKSSAKIPYGKEIRVPEYTGEEMKQLMRLNAATSRSPYTDNNDVTIYTSARDKYAELFKDLEEARDSIHLLYFILQNDNIGKKLIDLLAKKAGEGVEVRVLIDHGSNLFMPFRAYTPIIKNGGEVFSYFSNTINNYLKINFRNHRKIVVIDGKTGYTGGINIGDEYLGLHKKVKPWRDTHLKITGSSVLDLQLRFIEDWLYASKQASEKFDNRRYFPEIEGREDTTGTAGTSSTTGIQIVSSGPDTNGEEIKRGLLKLINSAKQKILIQTPYFVPDAAFLEALQNAALSGVEVCIQLPGVPDKQYVYKATMSYVADVLDYGIKIYLYPGFLHAKMLVVDDFCGVVGTANIDMRSFSLNFEIDAFMYGEEIAGRCTNIFDTDLKICRSLTREEFSRRSVFSRVAESTFRLFSPIL